MAKSELTIIKDALKEAVKSGLKINELIFAKQYFQDGKPLDSKYEQDDKGKYKTKDVSVGKESCPAIEKAIFESFNAQQNSKNSRTDKELRELLVGKKDDKGNVVVAPFWERDDWLSRSKTKKESFVDSNGKKKTRVVKDANGNAVMAYEFNNAKEVLMHLYYSLGVATRKAVEDEMIKIKTSRKPKAPKKTPSA